MVGKVSVIIPVYNVEKYIKKCLDSIIGQTYRDLEIIIINDGSDEKEDEIIADYIKKDSRIKYIKSEVNEGLYRARLKGVKASTGEYIQFVDGDDYISADYIRLLVNRSIEDHADIVYSTTVTCTPRGSETLFAFLNTELYRLPLCGDELRKVYWSQHGCAYVWHTIWNKLYSKDLWDRALPHLEKLKGHHVYTEDIAFTSVLYYFADMASFARNAVYYYCKHTDASTDSIGITYDKYKRQIKEVEHTFDFIRSFYSDKEIWIRKSVEKYSDYYVRMWHRIAMDMEKPEREKAIHLSKKLSIDQNENVTALEDNYFCYMETPYNGTIDEIKNRILNGNENIISFDVFDTLLQRSFYTPDDLFYMMDKKFEEFFKSSSSFYSIRVHAEEGCRRELCREGVEDVTLDEIYRYIHEIYGISEEICQELLAYELELEWEFNTRRNTGYELFEIAKISAKRIIITSDMYLPADFIDRLLKDKGYDGFTEIFVSSEYKRLKKTGNLFKLIINKLGVDPGSVLHIGDNIVGDIKAAENVGLHTFYLPRAVDVFCGKTERLTNKHRLSMGAEIAGGYRGDNSFEKNMSYGAALALAANKFFDDPYIGFNDFTDFNVDPYLAGYYVLGMNLIGQIEWLKKQLIKYQLKRIIFTSRDGKLLMDAFKTFMDNTGFSIPMEYLYVSRRSLLPWMISDEADFFELPIVYQKYSPRILEDLLSFCVKENDDEWNDILFRNCIEADKTFNVISEYHRYMRLFIENRYDLDKHYEARKVISAYLSQINTDDGIYDLGYSGNIHRAICLASNKNPMALFMHTDESKHVMNSRREGFVIESIMDTVPNISGLMREFFFSDTGGSCIGYSYDQYGEVKLVIEEENRYYTDVFPIEMMQRGALDMVSDYYRIFADHLEYMDIRTEEFLMPFESFLAEPTPLDTKMFIASYFEDKVYGRIERINVRDFWTQLLLGQKGYRKYDVVTYFKELLEKYGKKQLAFFGTGKMCEAMFEDYPDLPVDVFLDNNPSKNGGSHRGKKVIRPDDYPDLKELYIVVVIAFYKEVEEQLRDLGLTKYEDYLNYLELF